MFEDLRNIHDNLFDNFTTVNKRIRGDWRMWPHFKSCIGAIDDTHIGAIPTLRLCEIYW
jgi:hypothetical protein